MKAYFFLFLALFTYHIGQAQIKDDKEEKPTANRIWNVVVKGAYDVPSADMAARFGNSFKIGGSIKLKTATNWLLGGGVSFIVGGKVKEPGLLENIKTSAGDIINLYGSPLNLGIFQRGYAIDVHLGKILPYFSPNPNSGLTVETGLGFMQHKINLFDRDNNIPQVKGDYKKGYDRLTNGLFVRQFVGYTFYSKNRLINFSLGLESTFGFTQGRRDYWYDVAQAGNDKRLDILTGIVGCWHIPLYKKITEETYY
jgi:hypothetical protein